MKMQYHNSFEKIKMIPPHLGNDWQVYQGQKMFILSLWPVSVLTCAAVLEQWNAWLHHTVHSTCLLTIWHVWDDVGKLERTNSHVIKTSVISSSFNLNSPEAGGKITPQMKRPCFDINTCLALHYIKLVRWSWWYQRLNYLLVTRAPWEFESVVTVITCWDFDK